MKSATNSVWTSGLRSLPYQIVNVVSSEVLLAPEDAAYLARAPWSGGHGHGPGEAHEREPGEAREEDPGQTREHEGHEHGPGAHGGAGVLVEPGRATTRWWG